MKKKILFNVTSRADFSLAYPIIEEFIDYNKFKIYIVTSGYLSGKKYGKKIDLIKKKIKKIDYEIKNYPLKDNGKEITKSLADGVAKYSEYLDKVKPDFLFVFADKFEMLAPVISSLQFNIPICHIEGGDITEGALDDNIRHAITKLSHLHFVSTNEYKKRLIQLGEEKWRISVTGSPSLDLINQSKFKKKFELSKIYKFQNNEEYILCTFHPVTNEIQNTSRYIENLIKALKIQNKNIIFTSPNADLSRSIIEKKIKNFVSNNANAFYLDKISYIDYLSLMKSSCFLIGNSSSGIIEAASLKTKVINVGTRQKGRLAGKNVISCGYSVKEIKKSILQLSKIKNNFHNPYFKKNSSSRILKFFIKNLKNNLLLKKFRDIS